MPTPLGSKGQPDFSQPIAILMACHRRIEHFLGVLRAVVERYADRPLDEEGRTALETALNYFQQAGPRHTTDEEQSLFPRMRQCDDPAARAAFAKLDRLEQDHQDVAAWHQGIDTIGRRWLRDGRSDQADARALATLLDRLGAMYREHIQVEDHEVFALASHVLDAQALGEVGREMKQRRQQDPGRPGSRCARRRQDLQTSSKP
jgi:hemerythrin-like domain-containing protein